MPGKDHDGEGEDSRIPEEEGGLMHLMSRFGKLFEGRGQQDEDEEDQRLNDAAAIAPKSGNPFFGNVRPAQIRLTSAEPQPISVRQSLQTFEDARRAAEGLKEGTPQVINLISTRSDIAGRFIDFLTGAAEALDGSVTRIGESVYLFSPRKFVVTEEAAAGSSVYPVV